MSDHDPQPKPPNHPGPEHEGRSAPVPHGNHAAGSPGASRRMRMMRKWLKHHKVEIILAIVFAAVFAPPFALIVLPPEHHPYKIQVVESSRTDKETKDYFNDLRNPPLRVESMGDIPVVLETTVLRKDDEQTALEAARQLAAKSDTLMIIGHLPSQLTEVILPEVMKVRPQIPYISTSASADNLLERCNIKDHAIDGFVPLIQPSPRNTDEGTSAIGYAIQKQKRKFLIVTDGPLKDDDYLKSLDAAWRNEIRAAGAVVVGTHDNGDALKDEELRGWRPDCVLYAGDHGFAQTIMNSLAGSNWVQQSVAGSNVSVLAILADSVIESRSSDDDLTGLSNVGTQRLNSGLPLADLRFTYATNADDYNLHDNEYAQDAFSIARQLITDLSERGGDFRYRVRSLFHLENVRDARRNLVRIMKENAHLRSWYPCKPDPCVFSAYSGKEGLFHAKRRNGMFHIWQWNPGENRMQDVDGWHPPRSAVGMD